MTVSADALSSWAERYPQLALLFNPGASIEEHDVALERLIDGAVRWLEDNANYLKSVSEDLLSTMLAGKIEMPGLRAIRERNVNGHIDITIEIELSHPQQRWLAEAKRWKGSAYHVEGMKQLLDRYSTGRDRSAYVFDYVQATDIEAKWQGLRAYLDRSQPLDQQSECRDNPAIWAFESCHRHRSGRSIRLVHFGVNLG